MLRNSKVLAKLRAGKVARICANGHFMPFYVRHAAHNGYDGIWFDLEHRTMEAREVQSYLALCRMNDIDCMVRVPTRERTLLYRYLEEGATGFMFPFVSTAEIARRLVDCVKFPPLGDRGLDGSGIDSDYAIETRRPDSTYIQHSNEQTFVVAQIETPEAVRNVDEIAAAPGVDVLFVGPADLMLRVGALPAGERFTLQEAAERTAAAARKHGKAWGVATAALTDQTRYRAMGAQFMVRGGDFALADMLKQWSSELDQVESVAVSP